MPNKKSDELNNTTIDDSSSSTADTEDAMHENVSVEPWEQQVAELKELTRSLMAAVHEVRAQNVRNEMLRGTIDEVKADVRAASQAMLLAPPATNIIAEPHPAGRGGKCAPCDCVSDSCCCFEIVISQVRAAKPQIEAADAGDVGPTINALEVQMYFTVDRIGYLFPGLSTTMDLRADGLPGGPGTWVVIERPVNRVCIQKGTTVTKQLRVEIREHDEGIERVPFMKDELGEAVGTITLDCCMAEIFPPLPLDVYLMHGGEGRGMIQVAYYARRVCC
ncbi:MAG TPA: hypothetical protein VF721_19390 [Pyrinomonadaceae bacterium]|jgi:hypothetical protein